MRPERWRQVKPLLQSALELEPDRRRAFLDEKCAGDQELRREVESHLAAYDRAGGALDKPAVEIVAEGLGADPAQQKTLPLADRPPGSPLDDTLILPVANRTRAERQSGLPAPGMTLGGRYLIEKELGHGGMGTVYLARDMHLHSKPVVIKVLREELEGAEHIEWFKKKFRQEVEALARIDHPGVVGVLDAGEMPDGRLYFVMQYIEGSSLRSVMESNPMDLARVARIIRRVGHALSAAHDRGVYHRDLKPENIMIQNLEGGEELVKLIDFGMATVKDSQAAASGGVTKVAGTPNYMAPEQLKGEPSAASDIFAMGVIAYEMITGHLPFNSDSPLQLFDMQRLGVGVKPADLRPDLPQAAQRVILKTLSFEPCNRHPRARDFGEELALALNVNNELSRPPVRDLPPAERNDKIAEGKDTIIERALTGQLTEEATRDSATEAPVALRTEVVEASNTPSASSTAYQVALQFTRGRMPRLGCQISFVTGMLFLLFSASILYVRRSAISDRQLRGVAVPTSMSSPIPPLAPDNMVLIPGGKFQQGRSDGPDVERPAHPVTVAPFYIDRTEVTNAQYQRFVQETGRAAPGHWRQGQPPEGEADFPVVSVSWDDASAYARWVGKRLPTESEWEYAARGGSMQLLYPYGNEPKPQCSNCLEGKLGKATTVGSYPCGSSPFGVLDMAGNVAEWTASDYAPYSDGEAKPSDGAKVARGGAFNSAAAKQTATSRVAYDPRTARNYIGFRCAE